MKRGWPKNGLEDGKEVDLPHTFSVDSASEEHRGDFWYEYEFEVPEVWMEKRIWFSFHGIYRDADFWMNGEVAGKHYGAGFTTFDLDVTPWIRKGRNRLMIRGNNKYSPHALPWDQKFDWADDDR